jgi:hypothetical protein
MRAGDRCRQPVVILGPAAAARRPARPPAGRRRPARCPGPRPGVLARAPLVDGDRLHGAAGDRWHRLGPRRRRPPRRRGGRRDAGGMALGAVAFVVPVTTRPMTAPRRRSGVRPSGTTAAGGGSRPAAARRMARGSSPIAAEQPAASQRRARRETAAPGGTPRGRQRHREPVRPIRREGLNASRRSECRWGASSGIGVGDGATTAPSPSVTARG